MFGAAGNPGLGMLGQGGLGQGGMGGLGGLGGIGGLGQGGLYPGYPMGPQQEQIVCMELARRMEELYPVLQRAAGDKSLAAQGAATMGASPLGFVAYSYSYSDNPQVLQQASQFNPAYHVDYAKWAQAVQNNPDPRSCYAEPLVGLAALEQRIEVQHKAMQDSNNAMEEARAGFANLRDHLQAHSLQRLEECRRRHQMLSRQLLQVVSAVEAHAVASGAARRSPELEGHLEARLAHLEEAAHAPAVARARLEELWVVLRGLLDRGTQAGAGTKLTDNEEKATLQITASQGDLLEALQEELALRRRDVAQFENALARFTSAPPATQSI